MSVFNYKIEILNKQPDGTKQFEELHGWTRPFHDTTSLDESLDSGNFKLSCVTRTEMIKPFTPLRFTIEEQSFTFSGTAEELDSVRTHTTIGGKTAWDIDTPFGFYAISKVILNGIELPYSVTTVVYPNFTWVKTAIGMFITALPFTPTHCKIPIRS
jgi:hypothetical protein